MAKVYVYSTLTASQDYTGWVTGAGNLPQKAHSVKIAGGANLADKHLVTPMGVVTEIDEAELEFLRSNAVFRIHEKNGFVRIETKRRDVEAIVPAMEHRDPSAPDTPGDFVENSGVKVNVRAKKAGNAL